ncbi:MAG TPA: universal stress protein [Methyloceanibacter sp.]|jgi:nucleotide-binding universal stress UspA family protein|nr:universal stress protein [Methyloceanibacter sp.]
MKLVRILLPITQNGTNEACAAAGFGLAARFTAELEVLHPCPAPEERLPYSTELSPFYFGELIDVGKKQVALEKRQARKWFSKIARSHPKAKADLLSIEALPGQAVSMRAKVSDLTILPSIAAQDGGFWSSARDAALFHSGRPVLVMPKTAEGTVGEIVVIAWKQSVEAVRAVAAAGPFLAKAKRIKLVSVTEDGVDESATAIVDYLRKAGFRIEPVTLTAKSREAGEVLLEAAMGNGVLLVMGAYGRWRWREWVFGGATHYLLHHTPVPVLMTH